jgi:hypothetical protein
MPTFFRTTSGNHFTYGSYGLSSGGFESPETGNVTRLTYAAALGPRVSNEAKLARMSDKATCSGASFPQIDASADEGFLSAGNGSGTGFGCYVNQSLWEFGYDLGIDLGAHHVTVGTHNQLSRAARTRGRERPSPRLRSSR